MIRLVFLLRRRADLAPEAFAARWRDRHGPLVASHQERLGILRYVQAHRDPGAAESDEAAREARGGMAPPFDGADEFWWPSEESFAAATSTGEGQEAMAELIADQAEFVDQAESPFWFAHEYPQVSTQHGMPVAAAKTGVVKVYFPVRPAAGLGVEEAQRYWNTVHGPLARSRSSARGLIHYQQVHRFESPLLAEMRERRGTVAEPFIGHAEAWFDRLVPPRKGPEADETMQAALADERRFIDCPGSSIWTSKELVFVDRNWL